MTSLSKVAATGPFVRHVNVRVMGYVDEQQSDRFLSLCPVIEKQVVGSGIMLIKIWLETRQRCLSVRAGATAAGAVACLETLPARLATLAGVRGRRAAQNDSTASVTAALISA